MVMAWVVGQKGTVRATSRDSASSAGYCENLRGDPTSGPGHQPSIGRFSLPIFRHSRQSMRFCDLKDVTAILPSDPDRVTRHDHGPRWHGACYNESWYPSKRTTNGHRTVPPAGAFPPVFWYPFWYP